MHHAPVAGRGGGPPRGASRQRGRRIPRFCAPLSTDRTMRFLQACSVLAAVTFGMASAAAQTQPGTAQTAPAQAGTQQTSPVPSDGGTGWRVECANDGKALDCQTVNKVSQRESGQIVAAVAVRIPPDTKKPVLMVQLPLGIQVTEQISVQVDDHKAERFPIQTCAQNGCFVA